ncbi:hypothetical protein [uncultured Tateyamaria sp.]|uniref:hypothetical protein n=1 Tax=Tateyamaria sp. 1078 TaxID=3417464 RepID=UPI0026078928|nr:hypothetical protein [uncultured Tateyamaria sp.]
MKQIACPVALHPDGGTRRVPAFFGSGAGLQLVIGDVRDGAVPEAVAAHALFDYAGLETRSALRIGQSDDIVAGERWHFALCRIVPPVRDRWQHLHGKDGAPLLRFSWVPLEGDAPAGFDPRFLRALDWIKAAF